MSIKSQLKRSLGIVLKKDNENSYATRHDRAQILWRVAEEIVDLGYKILSIEQLKEKHIVAITHHWQEKKLRNSTIKNRLSALRRLTQLMDKPGLIPDNKTLQIGSRQTPLIQNRAIHNPDVSKITDPYVRVSLELQRHFGLRREESLKIKPHIADEGDKLKLLGSWCKGNRSREIPIHTEAQRYWLNEAKRLAYDIERSLIPESKSYIRHRYTYDKQLQNSGIRSHGLRHAYAQKRYKELTGWNCPLAGGPRQKDFNYEQRRKDIMARMTLSSELGHGRLQIIKNYCG
jgi:site-specific recombinase XerD